MAATSKSPAGCKCFAAVQKQLAVQGIALDSALQMDFSAGKGSMGGPFLAAHWIEKAPRGKRLPLMLCAYCPFCGKPAKGLRKSRKSA